MVRDWVHLVLRSMFGLLWEAQLTDDECGAIGGMRIGRRNWSTRRKLAPVPLCPPQIPHDMILARTRTAAVGSRRLTAWAMARPLNIFTSSYLHVPPNCCFRAQEPRHPDAWEAMQVYLQASITSKFISFTLQTFHSWWKYPKYLLNKRMGRTQNRSSIGDDEKKKSVLEVNRIPVIQPLVSHDFSSSQCSLHVSPISFIFRPDNTVFAYKCLLFRFSRYAETRYTKATYFFPRWKLVQKSEGPLE
jgi:hypothetical protein